MRCPQVRKLASAILWLGIASVVSGADADMTAGWSKDISSAEAHPDTQWFRDAKFGIFMHWGLYSLAGNEWQGKQYFGSAEWLMNRAKIPASEYAQLASHFNPVDFDAAAWARFVKESGARYLVITAKHHEGFAMFGSKVSPFNIVDATPFRRDPMTALSAACRGQGLQFGFYYSQYLDWHEPNGGGNTWDFKGPKDTQLYYAQKSIPQIKELLSNYGPLGIVWFDMPGGLNRDQTLSFMGEVRKLQPNCLISSRIGNRLGDFRDFGDSELPPDVIEGPWEALFTHNDSWGYANNDVNYKTPTEILHLLASTSARGGNLLLNVGPDGLGRLPEKSLNYLREVGAWLGEYGDSIYGTTHSPVPDQPWGVGTLKPGRLFLHVFNRPADGVIVVPNFQATALRAIFLDQSQVLPSTQEGTDLKVTLPEKLPDSKDTVVEVDFQRALKDSWKHAPGLISRQYPSFTLDAARADLSGKADLQSFTHSGYFGNWKHDTCAIGSSGPADKIAFPLRFLEPGDYRVSLEYACPREDEGRDGSIEIAGSVLHFRSLLTGDFDTHKPLLFIHHSVGVVTIASAGAANLVIRPDQDGSELFRLRRVVIEPVR